MHADKFDPKYIMEDPISKKQKMPASKSTMFDDPNLKLDLDDDGALLKMQLDLMSKVNNSNK